MPTPYDPQFARLRAQLEVAGRGLLNGDPILGSASRNAWDWVFKSEALSIVDAILERKASADGSVLDGVADQVVIGGQQVDFEAGIVSDLAPMIGTMFGTTTQSGSGSKWDRVYRFDRSGTRDLPESFSLRSDRNQAGRRYDFTNCLCPLMKFAVNPAGLVAVSTNVIVGGVSNFQSTPDGGNAGTIYVDGWDGVGLYAADADTIDIAVTGVSSGVVTFTATLNTGSPITYSGPVGTFLTLRGLIARSGAIAPVLPRVYFSADTAIGDTASVTNHPAGWTVNQDPDLLPLSQIWSYLNVGGVELPLQGMEIDLSRGASSGYNIGHRVPAYTVFEGAQLDCVLTCKRKAGVQLSEEQNLAFKRLRAGAIVPSAALAVVDSGQARPGATSPTDTYRLTFAATKFEASGSDATVDRTAAIGEETLTIKLLGNWTLTEYGNSQLPARV